MSSSFLPLANNPAKGLQEGAVFLGASLLLTFGSALVAGLAPLQFSIATVFLLAAPHNWFELRYCLARLPSKCGPLRTFFLTSFGGLGFLYAAYLSLFVAARAGVLSRQDGYFWLGVWNVALIGWAVALAAWRWRNRRRTTAACLAGLLIAAFALLQPDFFAISLVYLHPLLALAVLACELKRSRKSWLPYYRVCLAAVFLGVSAIVVALHAGGDVPISNMLEYKIAKHAGSTTLPCFSSRMLVAVHTFLEMVHYLIWCIAIPVASRVMPRSPMQIVKLPDSATRRQCFTWLFACSCVAVVLFQVAFSIDYAATREVYFTLAMVHVLAEVPLLMWLCPGRADRDKNAQVVMRQA